MTSSPKPFSTKPDRTPSPPDYTFFTDRDLGAAVPRRLGQAGLAVQRHDDHFPQGTLDTDWYPKVGREGWLALTHDKGQWRKTDERDAAMRAGVALFIIVGRMKHAALAELVVAMAGKMRSFRERHRPPFIAKVYRRDPRLKTHLTLPGRIELMLSLESWQERQKGR